MACALNGVSAVRDMGGPNLAEVKRPNAKAKLPGTPARTLKLGKPGWRPRSASAVGSAPSRRRGSLRLDSLQRHLEELAPRLPVLRNLPHLEPPTLVIQFDGIAHVAELRDLHPPHQLSVRYLRLGVLIGAPAGKRLESIAVGFVIIRDHRKGTVYDDLLPFVADSTAVHAIDGNEQPVELTLDDLGPLESPPLAGGELHPALALPLADEEVELLHCIPLARGASRWLTRTRTHDPRENKDGDPVKTSGHNRNPSPCNVMPPQPNDTLSSP